MKKVAGYGLIVLCDLLDRTPSLANLRKGRYIPSLKGCEWQIANKGFKLLGV